MAPSKLRKALGAVKDKTSISLAKVGSSSSIADLDVAIVKATRHEEYPADEKHIREILTLTSYSGIYITSCVSTLSRRLSKTHNWTVALKTLILIHRLLSEGDPSYEQEIFFATRRGTRLLNLSDFSDTSRSNSWDYSAFVRTFALYLDEKLDFRMHGRQNRQNRLSFGLRNDDDDDGGGNPARPTPVHEMTVEQIFHRIQQVQQLLERFLACRPTGEAKTNRVVVVALHPIVKESFQIYYDIAEIMGVLIDRFMELEIPDCVKVYEIFSRLAKQFEDLGAFYTWCKSVGVARSSEFPEVEKITAKKLQVMDEFIHEKSILAQRKKERIERSEEPKIEVDHEPEVQPSAEDDLLNMKALPAPEEAAPQEEEKEESKEEEKDDHHTQEEADFLNLREDAVTGQEQGDKLALALFAGESAPTASQPAWKAFKGEWADWETALVQSASSLSDQKPKLGGGFDTLLLDGMYQQAAAAAGPHAASGSASSMAFLGGTPGLPALPAPPLAAGDGGDPFAASLMIPAPSYVQMSDMERKQKLLVEEQLLWQQYARDGMQGNLGLARSRSTPPHTVNGGYTRSFQI